MCIARKAQILDWNYWDLQLRGVNPVSSGGGGGGGGIISLILSKFENLTRLGV